VANELPDNVRTHLFARSSQAHTNLVKESQGNWQNVNNLVRMVSLKHLDELQAAESRAVDKVLALPK
jgi:hypothetical protein